MPARRAVAAALLLLLAVTAQTVEARQLRGIGNSITDRVRVRVAGALADVGGSGNPGDAAGINRYVQSRISSALQRVSGTGSINGLQDYSRSRVQSALASAGNRPSTNQLTLDTQPIRDEVAALVDAALADVRGSAGSPINGIQGINEYVTGRVDEVLDRVDNRLENLLGGMPSQGFNDAIRQRVEEAVEAALGSVPEQGEFNDVVGDKVDEALDEVDDAVDEALDDVEDAVDGANDAVDDALDGVDDAVDEAVEDANDAAEDAVETAQDAIDGACQTDLRPTSTAMRASRGASAPPPVSACQLN